MMLLHLCENSLTVSLVLTVILQQLQVQSDCLIMSSDFPLVRGVLAAITSIQKNIPNMFNIYHHKSLCVHKHSTQ